MRALVTVFMFFSLSLTTYAQDSIERKSSLSASIDTTTFANKQSTIDSVVLSIQQFEDLKILLKDEYKTYKDILPSIVALLVVLISTLSAIYIGRRQIDTQTRAGEQQIRSQESQAVEQLKVSREQIQETSKMTLAQVRANNISMARINWVQDLRESLSKFVGEVAILNYYLSKVLKLNKTDEEEAKKLYDSQIERLKKVREYSFKIKLFLNENETEHKVLEQLIDSYLKAALVSLNSEKDEFNPILNEILKKSRVILKTAWEQAKK